MELLIGLVVGAWWAHHRIKRFHQQAIVVSAVHDERTIRQR